MCMLVHRCDVCDQKQFQESPAPGNKGQTRCRYRLPPDRCDLGLSAAGAALALLLRQPLIVASIAVDSLLGPLGVGVVVQSDERCAHYPDRQSGGTVDQTRRGRFHFVIGYLSRPTVWSPATSALDATNSPATSI